MTDAIAVSGYNKSVFFCGTFHNIFVRMLLGLVEGLIGVSMSLRMHSSRLDFFFFVIRPPNMSLIQRTMFLD